MALKTCIHLQRCTVEKLVNGRVRRKAVHRRDEHFETDQPNYLRISDPLPAMTATLTHPLRLAPGDHRLSSVYNVVRSAIQIAIDRKRANYTSGK